MMKTIFGMETNDEKMIDFLEYLEAEYEEIAKLEDDINTFFEDLIKE